jgi:GntR family transcriptional regulator
MAVPVKSCALAREPLYLQVCELLTGQIANGTWQPNAALPNEVDLARELGVSPGTVRKALEKLEAERLVVRRQGRGTFVVDQTAPEAASRFDRMRQADGTPIVWRGSLLEQSTGDPTPRERQMLQIEHGETVVRKRRLMGTSGRSLGVEEVFLAVGRLPGLDAAAVGDWCLTALAQRHGIHVARAIEELRPVAASPEIAALLAIEPGTPLLRLDRVVWSMDQVPIEWRTLTCHVHDEYYLVDMA